MGDTLDMASPPSSLLTPEQYLELERASEEKHEFIDGAMVAMAGGSIRYSAPHGQHDDTVMSLAIAWHGAAAMAQSSPISSTTRRF